MVGSGGGAGDSIMLTPISTFFVVPNEQVGQLYAYRINDSAVVLGTRRASTFGASIGIGSLANGTYRCLAENDNTNSQRIITVSTASKFICFPFVLLLATCCLFLSFNCCWCLHVVLSHIFQHSCGAPELDIIHICRPNL